jgi:sigma-54 specific flagellar transcriptional regulator A
MTDLDSKIIGTSTSTANLRKMIELVAPADSPVIVSGPTGSGKEVVADAIHNCSRRPGKFIAINCAAIPKELMEAEIFGFEKGAFTGALQTTKGKFEQANNGTLFLDEIGDMSLDLQTKLLRVLENSVITRVGSAKEIKLNVRIICATHKNLQTEVERQSFREDLLFRLNVFPVEVPSLSQRSDDVPALITHFLKMKIKGRQLAPPVFQEGALKKLSYYDWPGNVREVRNVVERALAFFPGKLITAEDVEKYLITVDASIIDRASEQDTLWEGFDDLTPTELVAQDDYQLPNPSPEAFASWFKTNTTVDLRKMLRDIEIVLIKGALEKNDNNTSGASKDLKLLRTTLIEKIKKYGLAS